MAKKRKGRLKHTDGTESDLERHFQQIWLSNYPRHKPLTQLQFHPTRKWLFDFAWPIQKLAVEVQGMGPGHVGLVAMTRDYDKLRAANLLGWKVVYLTKNHLLPEKATEVCDDIARFLGVYVERPRGYVPFNRR